MIVFYRYSSGDSVRLRRLRFARVDEGGTRLGS